MRPGDEAGDEAAGPLSSPAAEARREGPPTAIGSGAADRRLLGLTWAHLLNDGAANYLPGVLPAVLVSLHEPLQMAGALVAALTIGQALQPAIGWIADRLGGRSLVMAGLLLSSLGGSLLAVAHSTWLLIVLLLLIGLGSAFFHPQALAGVRDLVEERHGLRTSVFLVGGELGRGIWPTFASFVAVKFGLGGLWVVGVPGLVTLAFLYRWAPDLPPAPQRGRRIRWRRHGRPLMLLVAYQGVRAFTTFGLVTFIPVMWHVRGGSLVAGASIITTMLVMGVIGNLGGGHLADRLGRRPVLVVSALATAGLVFPVVYLDGAWVWIAAAPLGSALFLTASTSILIGQDMLPENRSTGSGIALGLANGIGALLVLVIGFWVHPGDVVTVFWVLAALSLASTVPALALPRALTHPQAAGAAATDR